MFLTGNIKVQVNLLHLPTSANFLIVKSIICCKNQKHFNQFTMSLLFCVILFYMIFLVSAAALRSTTVGSEPTSTGRCEPVGTEQMSTGHLVVFASLRSVQDIHRMSCTLVFALIRVRKHWWDDITQGKQ